MVSIDGKIKIDKRKRGLSVWASGQSYLYHKCRGRGMVFSTYCMNNSPQTDQNTHTPVTLTISTGCIQGEIKSLLLGGSKGQPERGPLFQDLTLWVVKQGMCRHFTCWGNRHAISLYYARLHVTLRGHCFKNKSELFLFHWVIRQCFRGIRSCLIFELLNKC